MPVVGLTVVPVEGRTVVLGLLIADEPVEGLDTEVEGLDTEVDGFTAEPVEGRTADEGRDAEVERDTDDDERDTDDDERDTDDDDERDAEELDDLVVDLFDEEDD